MKQIYFWVFGECNLLSQLSEMSQIESNDETWESNLTFSERGYLGVIW